MGSKIKDHVVRAMTVDGAFRVIAISMKETLKDVCQRQKLEGDAVIRMGELLAGTVLLRETIQPSRRVQVIYKDNKGGRLVADSKPDGSNRGLDNPGSEDGVTLDGDALLQVNYTLNNKNLHQGVVAFPADLTMSQALMRYMQESEQIVSVLDVRVSPNTSAMGQVAFGYVVQLTPESERKHVEEMTELLEAYDGIERAINDGGLSPNDMIKEILQGRDFSFLADSELKFGCSCSKKRMELGLKSLSRQDLGELLEDGKPIECQCDACGETFQFSTDAIAEMLVEKTPSDGLAN